MSHIIPPYKYAAPCRLCRYVLWLWKRSRPSFFFLFPFPISWTFRRGEGVGLWIDRGNKRGGSNLGWSEIKFVVISVLAFNRDNSIQQTEKCVGDERYDLFENYYGIGFNALFRRSMITRPKLPWKIHCLFVRMSWRSTITRTWVGDIVVWSVAALITMTFCAKH